MSINSVTLHGRLTRDPELRSLQTGTSVCNFGLAHNERRRNAEGGYDDVAHFFDCVVWGGFGELLANKLAKGSEVTVQGRLQQRSWEDEGNKRSRVEVVVSGCVGQDLYKKAVTPESDGKPSQNAPGVDPNDDIPF